MNIRSQEIQVVVDGVEPVGLEPKGKTYLQLELKRAWDETQTDNEDFLEILQT